MSEIHGPRRPPEEDGCPADVGRVQQVAAVITRVVAERLAVLSIQEQGWGVLRDGDQGVSQHLGKEGAASPPDLSKTACCHANAGRNAI